MAHYKIKEIYPWLYSICGPEDTYIYLVLGKDRALLYDTGYGLEPIEPVIRQITKLPFDVILSHGHHDHVNGACQFDEVWIDEKDLVLCMRHASRTARKRVLERMEKTGNALPEGFDSDSYILKGAGNLIKLKTGKIFNLGGLSGEVIGMKGHTAGSVGILLREEKVLLVGDAASPCAYMCLDESSAIADYIAMMEHTAALPFDVFFWGHEDTPLSKENHFLRFINVAKNICAERSTPFGGPYGIEGMLYQEDDVGIIFRKDKLKSKKSY